MRDAVVRSIACFRPIRLKEFSRGTPPQEPGPLRRGSVASTSLAGGIGRGRKKYTGKKCWETIRNVTLEKIGHVRLERAQGGSHELHWARWLTRWLLETGRRQLGERQVDVWIESVTRATWKIAGADSVRIQGQLVGRSSTGDREERAGPCSERAKPCPRAREQASEGGLRSA